MNDNAKSRNNMRPDKHLVEGILLSKMQLTTTDRIRPATDASPAVDQT